MVGTTPTPDAPGRSLGRYELAFELASGGMATVYLARAQGPAGFEKVVALKRIHPHLAKEQGFLDMFLDEARLASRISHPNVCSVFDFGEAGGTYYIAMEYILGETVSRLYKQIARSRLEPIGERVLAYVCRIVAEACEGLHAAHELKGPDGKLVNLVHRDISPQNLFVAYDGTVRIVDFGIARAEGRLHQTKTGAVKGKLAYMSPEQGRKLDLDRRSDIWAMGIVLWELLTGRRLFRRETDVDTILAVMNDGIPAPSSLREGIPKELDAIVMKALSRDRDDRWPSARKLGHALHRFLSTHVEEPVMTSDIADWMDELFGEEKARRAELVESARRSDFTGPIERVVEPLLVDDSSSDLAVSGTRDVSALTAPTVQTPSEAIPPPVLGGPPAPESGEIEELSISGLIEEGEVEDAGSEAPTEPVERLDAPVAPRRDQTTQPDAAEAIAGAEPAIVPVPVIDTPPKRSRESMVALSLVVSLLVGGAIAGLWMLGERGGAPAEGTEGALAESSAATEPATDLAVADEPLPGGDEAPPSGEPGAEGEASSAGDEVITPEEPATAEDEATTDDEAPEPEDEATTEDVTPAPEDEATEERERPASRRRGRRPPGRVNVATPGGWGDVYLGSRRLGRAPGRVTVPAGRRVLTVRPFGRTPGRRVSVNVPSGGVTRVVVPLSP